MEETHFFIVVTRFLLLAGGALIGSAMLWIGLRGLAVRRPFVIRGAWFTGAMLIGVASTATPGIALWCFFLPHVDVTSSLIVGWSLLMLGLASLTVFRLQGILGFGMTSAGLRDALLASLRGLDLNFKESLTVVELPEKRTTIEVAAEGWMGTAQVRASNREGRRLLPLIAQGMNRHFEAARGPVVLLSCATYASIGGVLVGLVTFFVCAA